MKDQDQIVRDEMRKLIKKSCKSPLSLESTYYPFHKSLLKFFFNSVDVTINYEKQNISLWNSKPISSDPVKLFFINEAIQAKVSYDNLEETLKGCLESGTRQTRFYKTLLFHYNNINNVIEQGSQSA